MHKLTRTWFFVIVASTAMIFFVIGHAVTVYQASAANNETNSRIDHLNHRLEAALKDKEPADLPATIL